MAPFSSRLPAACAIALAAIVGCGESLRGPDPGPAAAGATMSNTGGSLATGATAGRSAEGGAAGDGGLAGRSAGESGGGSGGARGTGMTGGAPAAGGTAAGGSHAGAASGGQADMPPDTDCNTPPEASELVGWATQNGSTTGGGNATPLVVTSALRAAIEAGAGPHG
jgi:hypothetical protein